MNSKELMNKAADNIRILAASMVEKAKSGHPGGAMGGADFINVLFSEFLEYDPKNMSFEGRDRFFLDPGHMAPMLYSQLALIGKFSMEELATLRQWGSPVTGHPELEVARGIENTSGPLGQGHVFAVGAAIAEKHLAAVLGEEVMNHKIYAYISDGGIQEEISQGAGRIAGTLGLDNLIMFYDSNDIQLSTECAVVTAENTAAKYRTWGWNVYEICGNDVDQIRGALTMAQNGNGKPTIIIGKTIMGKGALKADGTSYERNCKTHGAPLGGDAFINTIKNLGGDPANPFQIFPEVKKLYQQRRAELRKIMESIDVVLRDSTVTINSISIHGYASPEGPYNNNVRLAKGRAEALRTYLLGMYNFKSNVISQTSTPEDWAGLEKYVANSQLENKDKILEIIRNTKIPEDKREEQMKTLVGKSVYADLLKNVYPGLRHSDYAVNYTVRNYTLEEAKAIITKRPDLLSLNEMYQVANSYPKNSYKYNEAMSIAASTYPNDEVANLNAANCALENGNLNDAKTYLKHAGNIPQAIHALGVIAAMEKDFDKAEEYLKQSYSMGVKESAQVIPDLFQ